MPYGNGLILWKNFTADNELQQLTVEQGATKIINRFYNRADLTNVTGIIDGLAAANNETLAYNDAARLSSASGAYGTRGWTYDGNGNRTVETRNGVADVYNYPANSNRLVNVVRGSTALRVFAYDAAGNLTQNLRGANVLNYAINNAGRIRQMSYNGGAAVTDYVYDGFQKLRVKTSAAGTTHCIWDQFGHIITEKTGAFTREYIWLGDTPLAINEGATLSYVHADHLDRPVVMTTSGGPAVAWQAKYDPFGNVVTITSPTVMTARFPGQWFQIEDGLSYNWHRNYDPTLGRYSQADPLGFVDGPGVYNYAGQSPLMLADPDGQCPWCAAVILGALFGGAVDAGIQYLECGKVDWPQVGEAALIGGIGAGLGGARFLPWLGKGLEGSHWLPARYFRPNSPAFKPWLPKWLNGPLNTPRVSPWRHFKHDPFRFPKGAGGMGDKWRRPIQQFDRVPDWIKGGVGGSAAFELDQ